jgi:Bacterial archaeo-eukaryotic release factor family 5
MGWPSFEDARRLAEWQPPLGVVSVYLRVDPGDRGGAWRTELHNGLAAVRERGGELDHEAAKALRATVERIGERFENHERDLPRGEVGFVEVSGEPAAERWWSTHLAPRTAATASFSERPLVAPLLCLIEHGAARGVALLSAERVRMLEWAPGRLEELHNWELSIFSRDWRERKARRPADPARGQAVSASGRDQFDERLEDSRHRFLGECGRLAVEQARERGWHRLLLFGSADHLRDFRHRIPSTAGLAVEDAGEADLISEPPGKLEEPVAGAAARLDGERQRKLAERALEEARGGMRGTAGSQETEAALGEARVERLVLDAARADGSEAMVRSALAGGAAVSAVSGAAAELLAPVDGVAALLRY